MRQGWIIAQFAIFVARDAVDLANRREQFRLLDRVDTKIGFQIEIQIQHVLRIASLFHHQGEQPFLHVINRCLGRR